MLNLDSKKFFIFISALGTLAGTIVGVGFFALPYLTLEVGIIVMIFYFIFVSFLAILIHYLWGKIALLTPDYKRFPGFAKLYLGEKFEKAAYLISIFFLLGSLLAYLIVGGEFLAKLFEPIFGFNLFLFTTLYFLIGSIFIIFDIKAISKLGLMGFILFFGILISFFFFAKNQIHLENLFIIQPQKINFSTLLLPYGVLLFSLWGTALIPEVEEMLGENKNLLFPVIIFSILIATFIYLFFIFLTLGICGEKTTESALTCFSHFLDQRLVILSLFFGFLTTFTSFVPLGITLKKILWYDFGLSDKKSTFLTCFLPYFLYLLGFKKFISVISFVGAIFLGLEAILILLMYKKINPKSQIVTFLSLPFLLGIVVKIFAK
jgi:amino acid permease